MSTSSLRRTDIDLLRAFAVLAVILFHFEVPGFDGGFLGVDIFFVISGYLITAHIREQLSDGTFTFSQFYARRIRRLMPALVAIFVITSITSLLVFPRDLLLDFAHSQLASALYVSNIYFWSVADYFDTSSYLKPLLHTWSLSVEEQFYLFWPLCLFFVGVRHTRWFIVVAGVLSLIAAEIGYEVSATATFFMFPFRIFEFAIGAWISVAGIKNLAQSRAIVY
ncbi:MAG: acyltransferase [Haliea sp.]|nr:acyltransferase [Haliea sp.]